VLLPFPYFSPQIFALQEYPFDYGDASSQQREISVILCSYTKTKQNTPPLTYTNQKKNYPSSHHPA
jgi:hypothetical protein